MLEVLTHLLKAHWRNDKKNSYYVHYCPLQSQNQPSPQVKVYSNKDKTSLNVGRVKAFNSELVFYKLVKHNT